MRMLPCLLAALVSVEAAAQANAGVSDERVRLPQAPGSISGVGENATAEGNHGAVQYQVAVEVPEGFEGVTPHVALSYSSNAGASVVGIGWSMPSHAITRMTSRGLQRYGVADSFVVDESSELVRVDQGASSATYRARFESAFVRYTWLDRGTGEAGYWKAEFPDGRVGYYGADKAGTLVSSARVAVPGTARTFSWRLVLMEDAWGHQMRLSWTRDSSGTPLLDRIDYLFENGLPRHSVRFTYEPRADVITDAMPGFELKLTQRLKDIRIFSGAAASEQIRRYALEYESVATSGGGTRLSSVSRFGRGDVAYPVKFSFGYSKALGGACAANCEKPFVREMGTLTGVDFTTGTASLLDIDGDAIPDVLFTDAQGIHRFFHGKLDAEGRASFAATPTVSRMTVGSSPFVLGRSSVQLLDVNGDGFVDITESRLREVLCNDGSGDWVASAACAPTVAQAPATYASEADPPNQQDPRYVRFFDYDNDKRIDWLRTAPGSGSTEVLVNSTMGLTAVSVDTIGATFDESPLQLADVNGDGLQDPVQILASGASVTLQYKLNLGFGVWSPAWKTVTLGGFSASQVAELSLEDLNGDSLVDLVAVTGNEVALSLGQGGDTFGAVMTLRTADLGSGFIPSRNPTTTVSYADMNGNGSADIVWFQSDGSVQYLELFPIRPNLISRIDNGIGSIQRFSYGTSIVEQVRDATTSAAWTNRVPHATVVVTEVDSYVTLTGTETGGLHEKVTYRYHSGFYDGLEKQFRGYERVDQVQLAEATDAEEPSLTVQEFDVGKSNPAFAGHLKKRAVFSTATAAPVLVNEDRSELSSCPVAEVPAMLPLPVVFVCVRAESTVVAERDLANARTLEVQREYDGYGNVVRETNLGVKHLGPPEAPAACDACAASGLYGQPCGAQCVGDESFTTTTFITPGTDTGGAWRLNEPSRVLHGGSAASQRLETLTFYDGPAFVGLPAGKLTSGGVTRVSQRFGPGTGDFIEQSRVRLDAHGNPAESIEPNGTLTGTSHRRLYTYDAAGRWPSRVDVALEGSRVLRRDLAFDPAFELMSQSSNWFPVVNGQPAASPQQTRYRYDDHGRLSKVLAPGDTDTTASTEYQYELADPATRVVTRRRTSAVSAADLVTAECLDGRGRSVQTRQQLTATRWQVSGFTEYDKRGAQVRVFQPFVSPSGACDTAAPQGVPFTRMTYDVMQRLMSEVEPDGSVRRSEYGPLTRRVFDEDDNDPMSPSANTPTVEVRDGLDRLVSLQRTRPGSAPATTQLEYDGDGFLLAVKDPGGHRHVQRYDLLGRVVEVNDPNSGTTRMTWDAAGNRVATTDARNVVVRSQFDAFDRLVAQWDEADEAKTRVTWTYDVTSGCLECSNAGGQVAQIDWTTDGAPARDRFGYDARGRLVFEERTVTGRALVTRHRYDSADRLISTLYPAGLTVEPRFDGASRVVGMPGYLTSVEYTERGLPGTSVFANGVRTTLEYDVRLRPSRRKVETPDAKSVLDLKYSRSRRGDLLTLTDDGARPERARHAGVFVHDAWSRVTRAQLERPSGDPEVLSYEFDDLDNVVSLQSSLGPSSRAHVGAYAYDPTKVNAVIKAGDVTSGYDAAGAITSRGSSTFTRDHLGRITSAERGGRETGSFGYGPGPARVVKHEGDSTTWLLSPDFEVRDGIAVVYARVGSSRIARAESAALAATLLSDLAPATGTGTLTPTGDGVIDVGDAWLAQAASLGAIQLTGGPAPSPVKALLASASRRLLVRDAVWLHEDELESVVAATDERGALLAEQSFFPSGTLRSSSGFVDVYGFTGQPFESSTGFIHFQYRDLDPQTGRWASVDPAFTTLTPERVTQLGEATTAYAYVANDFFGSVDPTGLGKIARLKDVKARPGIYHVGVRGTINKQYVGEARNLKSRLNNPAKHPKFHALLSAPGSFLRIAYLKVGKAASKENLNRLLRYHEQRTMTAVGSNPNGTGKGVYKGLKSDNDARGSAPSKMTERKKLNDDHKAVLGTFTDHP